MEPITVRIAVSPDTVDRVAGQLWALGTIGVEEQTDELIGHFSSIEGAERAAESLGPMAALASGPAIDWVDTQRQWLSATRVGPLTIRPPWVDTPDAAGPLDLVIDPGPTFGHGAHPTTRLALEALVDEIRDTDTVLDVGCGSGVLAIAAAALGAQRTTAIDIDADAVAATDINARANAVAGRIDASTAPVDLVAGAFDVVVANLTAATSTPLAGAIRARARRTIILSGMLDAQVDDVVRAVPEAVVRRRFSLDGWTAVSMACDVAEPSS